MSPLLRAFLGAWSLVILFFVALWRLEVWTRRNCSKHYPGEDE